MSKAPRPTTQRRRKIRSILRSKQGGKCCYCERDMLVWGKPVPKGGPPKEVETIEHLHRLDDGGTNALDNLALSCFECNVGRGSLDWLTYKSLKRGEFEAAA